MERSVLCMTARSLLRPQEWLERLAIPVCLPDTQRMRTTRAKQVEKTEVLGLIDAPGMNPLASGLVAKDFPRAR